MLWKLLSGVIRSRWRTFCGLSKDDFLVNVVTVLDELGYTYDKTEVTTTQGEKRLLGAESTGIRISVSEPIAFDLTIIVATVDPMTNFMMSMFITENEIERMTSDLSVVTVSNINSETRPLIAQLMSRVITECDRPPWKLTHHLNFRLAVLLRVKVKLLWTYWLRAASNEGETEQ